MKSKLPKKIKSPLRYPGAKSRMSKTLVDLFPSGCKSYREPFLGGGSVFFEAKHRGLFGGYWLNDCFPELMQFWYGVADAEANHEVRAGLQHILQRCQSEPELYKALHRGFLDEASNSTVDAAIRFFYLNRVSWSGSTFSGGLSMSAARTRFTRSSIDRLSPIPTAVDSSVWLSTLDFADVINEPGEGVFIYADPPYVEASRLYGKKGELQRFNHERLYHMLLNTKHKFLLSYDDCAYTREVYSWAKIRTMDAVYGMTNVKKKKCKRVAELVITNY